MGKKCIPGVICIENMTLFVLFVIVLMLCYLYFQINKQNTNISSSSNQKLIYVQTPLAGISTRNDPINDPYYPPIKTDGIYHMRNSSDIRGVPAIPINIQTQSTGLDYSQIGILTRTNMNREEQILPLMGRRIMTGRDKWQYYTISNTGTINTKLPVSVNGKSCTNEYGCDDIQNGDRVYVEGYNDSFTVTLYENAAFSYIPYV
jgi:hypothetical protein